LLRLSALLLAKRERENELRCCSLVVFFTLFQNDVCLNNPDTGQLFFLSLRSDQKVSIMTRNGASALQYF